VEEPVTPEPIEQTETICWSYFPPGHRGRLDWSISAHATGDGWWYLTSPGVYLDRDLIWQPGHPNMDRVARTNLETARKWAHDYLSDMVVAGRTATEAYDEAKAKGHV
jgi:hypothetical protein